MIGKDWLGIILLATVIAFGFLGKQYLHQDHVQKMTEKGYEEIITNNNSRILGESKRL